MKSKTGDDKEGEEFKLKQEFVDDYRKFAQEFDLIVQDLFRGVELYELSQDFIKRHKCYLSTLPYCAEVVRGKLPLSSKRETVLCQDTIREDLAIVNSPAEALSDGDDVDNGDDTRYEKILAGLYRRAGEACLLRVTYNKDAFNLDGDCDEPLHLSRHAIRYNPNSFHVCYWWMIAVGWKLEQLRSGARDRISMGTLFSHSTRRTMRLKPDDPLAYNLLGRYHFNCSELNWFQKALMQRVLGTKVTSTFQDAERYFRKAHELKDDWPPTGLWMAKVLLAQKAPLSEVERWLDFGLNTKCLDPSAALERKEILELKAKLKLTS